MSTIRLYLWPFAIAALCAVAANAKELTHFRTVIGTDVTSAGVGGLRGVATGGDINLQGVSGTVREAYLYWHGHGVRETLDANAQGTVRFAGQLISGAPNLGLSSPDGWSFIPHNLFYGQAFRADVTALVSDDGLYTVQDFAPLGTNVQGASLVVLFDDGNAANNVDVSIYDGNDANDNGIFDAFGWNLFIPQIPYLTGDSVTLQLHVSDGQVRYLDDGLTLNGQVLAPAGQVFAGTAPFDASGPFDIGFFEGSLWDLTTFDISTFLDSGLNDLHLTTGIVDDNLSLVAALVQSHTGSGTPGGGGNPQNSPPRISCSIPVTFDCVPAAGLTAMVTAEVYDADGEALNVIWIVNGKGVLSATVPAGSPVTSATVPLSYLFAVGNNTVVATVNDPQGGFASSTTTVTLTSVDITAPDIDCGPEVHAVASPSTGLAIVPSLLSQVTASDACTPTPSLTLAQSPNPGTPLAVGTHPITVYVSDLAGNVAFCQVNFIVTAQAEPPPPSSALTAVDDSAATLQDQSVTTGNVLANDSSDEGAALFVHAFDAYSAAGGNVVYNGNGAFAYTPPSGFSGLDTFSYTAADTAHGIDTALVVITVTPLPPVNQPPVAQDDSAQTEQDTPVTIAILANDSDPDGPLLTIVALTQPLHGAAVLNLDGTISYTPAPGFSGQDSFTYTIEDSGGATASATVTIAVTPAPNCGQLTTFTQGGWGSQPSGNNPGALLANNFSALFPNGVTIGGIKTLRFTSAAAVERFLPQGGTAGALSQSLVDPSKKISVLAGQLLALELNISFSALGITTPGLAQQEITSGNFAGYTVAEFRDLANAVLGGSLQMLPSSCTLADLNDAATRINENFDNGTANQGFLSCP